MMDLRANDRNVVKNKVVKRQKLTQRAMSYDTNKNKEKEGEHGSAEMILQSGVTKTGRSRVREKHE